MKYNPRIMLLWCDLCNCPAWWRIHEDMEAKTPHEKDHVHAEESKGKGDILPPDKYITVMRDDGAMVVVGIVQEAATKR